MLKFNFSVGKSEIHEIEFKFNQFWGNTYIMVDGEKIIKTQLIVSFRLKKVMNYA